MPDKEQVLTIDAMAKPYSGFLGTVVTPTQKQYPEGSEGAVLELLDNWDNIAPEDIAVAQEKLTMLLSNMSYEELKNNISSKDFGDARIIITGDGRVAKGSLEFLEFAKINQVSPDEYLKNNNTSAIFCNLPTSSYVSCKDGRDFNLQHFINFPEKYISVLDKYLQTTNMLITSHYWDPKSPRLFKKNDFAKYTKLKVIGDITCDINGSIPTTLKSTTIKNPYFYLNPITFEEVEKNNDSIAIMAVDNLPSELPRDSSKEFGDGIVNEVLPFMIKKDDGRILNATITHKGRFLNKYQYLLSYINS